MRGVYKLSNVSDTGGHGKRGLYSAVYDVVSTCDIPYVPPRSISISFSNHDPESNNSELWNSQPQATFGYYKKGKNFTYAKKDVAIATVSPYTPKLPRTISLPSSQPGDLKTRLFVYTRTTTRLVTIVRQIVWHATSYLWGDGPLTKFEETPGGGFGAGPGPTSHASTCCHH